MAARLDMVKLTPSRLLDLGCGTGADFMPLQARYPKARLLGVDASAAMLARSIERGSKVKRWLAPLLGTERDLLQADAAALPLASRSIDMVWSNLALQHVAHLDACLGEVRRVLKIGGLFMFSTLGPDTLRELRAACLEAGLGERVHRQLDMHDLGDLLVHAGFAEPVMDMEYIQLTYTDADALLADLIATGGGSALPDRPAGLTTPRQLAKLKAACAARARDGRLSMSMEIVFGHAWKAQPRTAEDGRAVVQFSPKPRR